MLIRIIIEIALRKSSKNTFEKHFKFVSKKIKTEIFIKDIIEGIRSHKKDFVKDIIETR